MKKQGKILALIPSKTFLIAFIFTSAKSNVIFFGLKFHIFFRQLYNSVNVSLSSWLNKTTQQIKKVSIELSYPIIISNALHWGILFVRHLQEELIKYNYKNFFPIIMKLIKIFS